MSKKLEGLMTVVEVADYLRVNRLTVYRLAERGELPGSKVGSLWRFKERDIAAWLEQQKRSRQGRQGPRRR